MRLTLVSLAVAGVAFAGNVQAQSGEDLLKKYACVACHQIDKKVVGPAYKDVATKYRGNAKAPAMLAEHIKKGSVNVWGPIPMPPNTQVPDADVQKLVSYILALK